jgi:glycosyltransferase involved in cell wall biosynthesis
MYSSLSIVIPVYNESESIEPTLTEIETKIKTPHEILIVYDFDEDSTLPVVRRYMESNSKVRLVRNKYGKGVLNAIKSGFQEATYNAVLVVMADLSDDLGKVDKMFDKINEGYDIVCGSRYMKGGRQIGGPWIKKTLSRIAGVSLHYLAGIPTHDITNSFKIYTRRVLESVIIESSGGFELGMEITIKAFQKGMKITEIPSVWMDRSAGESKFMLWKWFPRYFHWYMVALKGRLPKLLSIY